MQVTRMIKVPKMIRCHCSGTVRVHSNIGGRKWKRWQLRSKQKDMHQRWWNRAVLPYRSTTVHRTEKLVILSFSAMLLVKNVAW